MESDASKYKKIYNDMRNKPKFLFYENIFFNKITRSESSQNLIFCNIEAEKCRKNYNKEEFQKKFFENI